MENPPTPSAASGYQLSTIRHQLPDGCQTWTRTKTSGLTGRRATLTLPGNGAAGRISTCIVPFRRRMPHVFGHDSNSNWSEWQDFHLRPPGPKVLPHSHQRLNHSREIKKGREDSHTPGPRHFNKEQTPLGDLLDP